MWKQAKARFWILPAIIGGIICALALQKDAKRRHADGNKNRPASKKAGAPALSENMKAEYRGDKEESYWFWTKWAAIATAGGAIVAAVLAFGAFRQAQRQADASEEANRPWVAIRSVSPNILDLKKDTVSLSVVIELQNVGNSPAKQILWGAFIEVQGDQFGPASGQEACQRVDVERENALLEDVVFPKNVEKRMAVAVRSTEEIVAQNEILISRAIKEDGAYDNRKRNLRKELAGLIKYDVSLILVGCVTYVDSKAGGHSTSFAFVLHPRAKKDGVDTFDMSAYPQIIDNTRLSLEPSTEGSFAN